MRNLFRLRLLIPGIMVALLAACPRPLPVQPSLGLYPEGCDLPAMRDPHWSVSPQAEALLVASGYCQFHVAGIHDEQALAAGGDSLGPVVKIFAAPNAGVLTGDRAFEGDWVNVAILAREAGVPPTAYAELGLTPTLTCLYLRRVPRALIFREWKGMMTEPVGGACPAAIERVEGVQLAVDAERPFSAPNEYPVAARFTESLARGGVPHTKFGVRCGNAWCLVGLRSQRVPPPVLRDQPARGVGARTRAVRGWFDEQALSLRTTQPGRPLQRSMRAVIAPSDSLEHWTHAAFAVEPRHVATIVVPGVVPEKYASGYALTEGENAIRIVRQDTTWTALINGREHEVRYHPHPGIEVPAFARWLWDPNDEQIWVRCDVGCCRVIENES